MANAEVIPIFLDETTFVGLPQDTVGVKFHWNPEEEGWKDIVIDRIVFKIMEKLN